MAKIPSEEESTLVVPVWGTNCLSKGDVASPLCAKGERYRLVVTDASTRRQTTYFMNHPLVPKDMKTATKNHGKMSKLMLENDMGKRQPTIRYETFMTAEAYLRFLLGIEGLRTSMTTCSGR